MFDKNLTLNDVDSEIAKVIDKAIDAKNPKTRYSAGAYSWILLTMRSILSDRWFDKLIVKVTG